MVVQESRRHQALKRSNKQLRTWFICQKWNFTSWCVVENKIATRNFSKWIWRKLFHELPESSVECAVIFDTSVRFTDTGKITWSRRFIYLLCSSEWNVVFTYPDTPLVSFTLCYSLTRAVPFVLCPTLHFPLFYLRYTCICRNLIEESTV